MKFKLPEPIELSSPHDERAVYGYTEAQLKQAIKDALEQAAKECDAKHDTARTSPGAATADACARRIRNMIGEIK